MPRCQWPVGRNKLAQFRHRNSAFAVGLPELRKLVPAYKLATNVKLHGASLSREAFTFVGPFEGSQPA